jgi:hypothetical protein
MPSTLFDSAGLAIVAYVQVNGADGSSNSTLLANSGVTTTKVLGSTGNYLIFLSTAVGQDPSRDLIFVQPVVRSFDPVSTPPLPFPPFPPSTLVVDLDNDKYTKQIMIGGSGWTTALDCDFNVLILRTILPS